MIVFQFFKGSSSKLCKFQASSGDSDNSDNSDNSDYSDYSDYSDDGEGLATETASAG